jgi:SMC interacting uncharacterized protein involved in chromosome segregation
MEKQLEYLQQIRKKQQTNYLQQIEKLNQSISSLKYQFTKSNIEKEEYTKLLYEKEQMLQRTLISLDMTKEEVKRLFNEKSTNRVKELKDSQEM